MPRITIGIPVFNEERHVAETVKSALSQVQDYSDLAILISDNGSTDSTVECIEQTLATSEDAERHVQLIKHDQNLGAFHNWWSLFDSSDSEYFLWLGGHDQLSKGFIGQGMEFMKKSPDFSMFSGAHAAIGSEAPAVVKPINYNFSQENAVERYLTSIRDLNNCYIFHSIFRRRTLATLARPKEVPSADHILISRWLWHGKLYQSETCAYVRRYFSSENRAEKQEAGSYVHRKNNVAFFESYLEDFERLTEPLPGLLRKNLVGQAYDVLVARFGLPFLEG